MLKLTHVTKKFGELTAVNDLSFEVAKGQVFGIAGPNGAGKSTLYNLITGLYPFEGTIEFKGKSIQGLPPHRIAKLGISRTFQIPQTFPSLTVAKSIGVGNYFGSAQGFDPDYVATILKFVNLENKKDARTGQLKLLDKKMLMIGAALATKPDILMLDEPMAGSNAKEIRKLMDLIQRINQDLGITIIIIEHFMKVLTELTQKLLIIETGTEICCGDPVEVTSDPRVIECYLGDNHA
jgi:branched-chain amino acid transport system ATP-binding protein